MKTHINDEFTHLAISRQRKYQLRRERDGRCTQCGEPVVGGKRCLKHLIQARERQRRTHGLKRRYFGTLSYKLQATWQSAPVYVAAAAPQLATPAVVG